MLRLKLKICVYMLATALFPTVATQAATYYVSPNGNDSNSGTEAAPFRTIKKGAQVLRAGDTTYIKNGTYVESNFVRIYHGGTKEAPVKLKAYPGHSPVLRFPVVDPNNLTYPQFVVQQSPGHNTPIGWVTIEGLTFEYGYWGIHAYACNHCTFRRNWFKDQFGSGILIWSAIDTVIDGNIVSEAGSFRSDGSGRAHGIYLTGSRYVITNNLIYGSATYAIQLNGNIAFKASDFPNEEYSDTKDAIIANNVLAYSVKGSGIVIWGTRATNARIENNIFYENWQSGPSSYPNGINWIDCCSTGVQIRNNIFYASGSGGTAWIYGSAVEGIHYTKSGNLVNTDNPRFINAPAILPPSPNFKLTEWSPAIDNGLLLTVARTDFDGATRPQRRAYDIGAYEYSTGNDTASPAAPMGLQAR
jgi:hypothetical protein